MRRRIIVIVCCALLATAGLAVVVRFAVISWLESSVRGPTFSPGAGPVSRVSLPAGWRFSRVKMYRSYPGGFIVDAFRGKEDFTIICNPENARFIALQARAAISVPSGRIPTAGVLRTWEVHRLKQGGFWAVSRSSPIVAMGNNRWMFERANWDRRDIRGALNSVVLRKITNHPTGHGTRKGDIQHFGISPTK